MQSVKNSRNRPDREQNRLATKMNVPPVDDNLYVKLLQNRDIPYQLNLLLLTDWSAKQSNPILDLANLTSKIAGQ